MFPHTRAPLVSLSLLVALLALAVTATPARGQAFQAVILDRPGNINHAEGTGISRDGVVSGYGWEVDDSSPRRGLRWTPNFNYQAGESPQMDGNLASVVFNGIDPVSNWPFGAAVGPDTGGHIHAIQVDEIVPDPVISDLFFGRWTDKHPSGFSESQILGGSPDYRVGYGIPNSGSAPHSVLWDLTTGTVYDLHPSGFTSSTAAAVIGQSINFHIAGWGEQSGFDRALTWFFDSFGIPATNLHPNGYDSSRAYGMSSRWTVGTGSPANSGTQHALSFNAPGNATDLDPSWSSYSQALGASEAGIVGYTGSSLYGRRALYWSDADANQVIDLHQFLPPDYIASYAVGLNDAKMIVGTAFDSSGERHAVVWRPVQQFSLLFRPGFTPSARIVTAYVFLEKPAPKGGLRITLSPTTSLKNYAWSLQKEVVIAEGKTWATFSVATTEQRPLKPVRATITATWGKEIRRVTLTINP